jgi:flagellin
LTGVSATTSATGLSFNSTQFGSKHFVSVRALSGTFDVVPGDQGDNEDSGRDAGVMFNGQTATVDGLIAKIRSNGLDIVADLTQAFGTTPGSDTFSITGGGANFQIGPQVTSDGLVSIGVPAVTTSNLGDSVNGYLNTLGSGGTSEIVNSDNHPSAEAIVRAAILQVATLSGRLGGFQANQIETNLNSLRATLENVTASESAIRDTDYAVEVSRLTRSQIMLQSTIQMLGVANSLPQSVLALLG